MVALPGKWNENSELTSEQVFEAQRYAHSLRKAPPLEFFYVPGEGFECVDPPGSVSLVAWDPDRHGELPRSWVHAAACNCDFCRS